MSKKSIALIGMAGAGKSTIGKQLAAKLEFNFIDLDEYISGKEGQTIQGIIDLEGEESLLRFEEKYLREIDLHRVVIAPGGSIIYRPALMEYLKQRSILVFLDEPFETIRKRLKNAATRGIIGYPLKSLHAIYVERRPLYFSYADYTINPQNQTPAQVASAIIDMVAGELKHQKR